MLAKSKYLVYTKEVLLPLCILALLALGYYIVFYSPSFTIRHITCLSDFRPCKNEAVLAELAKQQGQNILQFQTGALQSKLLSGNYMLESVQVKKILPDKLELELWSVNPSYAIRLQGDSSDWIVCDQEGRVIDVRQNDPNVSTIRVQALPSIHVGRVLPDDNLAKSGQLVMLLLRQNITPKTIELEPSGVLNLKLDFGLHVVMTTKAEDLRVQVASLQATLQDSTIKNESSSTLDVRFAQPILKQN